jgi:hypothetical protein
VAIATAAGPSAALAASAPPKIDLKVLLLGTSTSEPDFQSWQAALQREGVPFDTIIASSGHTPITSSTLSTTASDGTPEGKYEAIIVSVAGLPICSTSCVSGLAQSEWTAIEAYEQAFFVRQLTGDESGFSYPGQPANANAINPPTTAGSLDGTRGTLTADGAKIFPYLQASAPVTMDTGTFGYESTPVSGANFDPLVTCSSCNPSGAPLVGIYIHSDGVQELIETFNQNQFQLQSELLRHGALNWVTRGVYFGDQRNYIETHIDDNFLADDSWNTTTHSTDFTPANALREVPADVDTAANWSAQNHFRIDMLFNGDGSVQWANGCITALAGDAGSGGSTSGCNSSAPGSDPLLAKFQQDRNDFGWINHTWDHPNIDQGCASQNFIEAELNENTNWGAKAVGSTPGDPNSGGLGLTESTDPSVALGNENPGVVVTGEHSGFANLLPGNPGLVDPPSFNAATASTSSGTLGTGSYQYAITDQFSNSASAGESSASISAPVAVTGPTGSVRLTWNAVCHAADYKIYREVAGSNSWSLLTTIAAPSGNPPNSSFDDPNSTTDVTGGGAQQQSYTDQGLPGTPSSAPPSANNAVEGYYQQNTQLNAAFGATLLGGIKYAGVDSSKPYPNPPTATFANGSPGTTYPGATFAAGATFTDGQTTAVPRYPTNIYYNVATQAQETDEYNYLYDLPTCKPVPGVTTCNPQGTNVTFAQIVASVDQGMFQHLMGNDPRPSYFHQTNLMTQQTGDPTSTGDGLFYSTMNPLLAEYNGYFSAPIVQLTMPQIGQLLTQQVAWSSAATARQVTGYIQGNQVTLQNGGGPIQTPLTGIPSVGSVYGGIQSGWQSVPSGNSNYTAGIYWGPFTAPVNTAAPTVTPTGTVQVGQTLTASTGTFTSPATAYVPLTYSYQWEQCPSGATTGTGCTPISGATASTYTVASGDVDHNITVVVTATDYAKQAGTGTAVPVGPAVPVAPVSTAAPQISGSTTVGQTLTTDNGTFAANGTLTYAYQWKQCDSSGQACTPIAGATGSSYTLTSADLGHQITVVVTATDHWGRSGSGTATPVGPVANPPAPATATQPADTTTTSGSQTSQGSGASQSGPAISNLTVSPVGFTAMASGASTAKASKRGGATISYTDSQAATTTFTVLKPQPGVKKGGKCVRPPNAKGKAKGKRCTRYVAVGSFIHHDHAGANHFRFTGRIRGRKLAPGSYGLSAVARLNGRHSDAATVGFLIRRR